MDQADPQPSLGSVLVVGGCGFLGHHIVQALAKSGQASTVTVLDLQTTQNRQADVGYHQGDISSWSGVSSIFDRVKPDVVIHTASPSGTGAAHDLLRRVNVVGTKNLIELAGRHGCKAFILTSSPSVISDGQSDLINADERWAYIPPDAQSEYYAQTKAEAEMFVLAANRQDQYQQMLTAAIRPASMIGEGDVQQIPPMIKVLRSETTAFQLGMNDNLFDFTYVGNVAHAHIQLATALMRSSRQPDGTTLHRDDHRVDGEAFLITNDSPIYFWDMPRLVWYLAGDPREIHDVYRIPFSLGLFLASSLEFVMALFSRRPTLTRQNVKYSTMARYYNCRKARDRFGYTPIVDLEEGVRRAIKWALDHESATPTTTTTTTTTTSPLQPSSSS